MYLSGMTAPITGRDPVEMLDDARRVAAVLPPLRQQILGKLDQNPDSAAGLARAMGVPRQRLNYHVRELERAGFVELAETRQRRGCVERVLRPTARAYLLSPDLLGRLAADPDAIRDRFSSAYLIASASRIMSDVSVLRRRAEREGKPLATFTLQTDIAFRSPADRTAFAGELADAVAQLAAKYHHEDPGSRRHRFVVSGHPVITKTEDETAGTGQEEDAP